MDTCKYIVIDTAEGGPAAFMFPPFIQHVDFTRCLGFRRGDASLLSAGFVKTTKSGLVAYGDSESLKLKADPERDNRLLNRLLPQEK